VIEKAGATDVACKGQCMGVKPLRISGGYSEYLTTSLDRDITLENCVKKEYGSKVKP